jgi:hypothetical protein
MLNHAARFDWLVNHDQMRPSVLGRAIGRKALAPRTPGETRDDDDDAQRSPATDGEIHAFFDAFHLGDGAGQQEALNKIVRTWRADNAAGGVPVHAHLPLPKAFAADLARLLQQSGADDEPDTTAHAVANLDMSVRTFVAQQIAAHMAESLQRDGRSDEPTVGPDSSDAGVGRRGPGSALHPRANVQLPSLRSYDASHQRQDAPLEDDARLVRDRASAHVEARPDFFKTREPEHGGGRFETLPYDPRRQSPQTEELSLGTGFKIAKRWGRKALVGGGLSVVAEWVVNRDEATGLDYTLAFLSGAATGILETDSKSDKAKLDAGLAIGTSLAGDVLNGDDPQVLAALGAGLAAYTISRLGGSKGAQAAGRFGRKAGEKFAKEYATAILKKGLEELGLTKEEWDQFWRGFEAFWREKWEEFLQRGDTDPTT